MKSAMRIEVIVVFLLLTLVTRVTAAEWTIVHAGKLLAEPGEAVLLKKSVIIKAGKVESIKDGFVQAATLSTVNPDDISLVDLSDYFLLKKKENKHENIITSDTIKRE